MKRIYWLLTLFSVVPALVVHADDPDFVDVAKVDFSIRQDIRYATKDNFTKEIVYPEAKCALRKPVALALSRVQANLKLMGFGLKVWDCYRPLSVQKKFWAIKPDERYVADPKKGSVHNRGAAVDVTLVKANGDELEMPTEFDDFSRKAHRDYKGLTKAALKNRKRLEDAMVKEGFVPFATEWWHFDFKGGEAFGIADVPLSSIK